MDREDTIGINDGKSGDVEVHVTEKDKACSAYRDNGTEKHAKETRDETTIALVNIEQDEEPLFHYDVFEVPPFFLTIFFALQVMLNILDDHLVMAVREPNQLHHWICNFYL